MTTAASNTAPGPVGLSPTLSDFHQHMVALRWDYLRIVERMNPLDAQQAQGRAGVATPHINPEAAVQAVEGLTPWPGLPDGALKAYARGPNQRRVARALQYITPEDRVLDIGCGFGHVSGLVLRNVAPQFYVGVDIGRHRIAAARNMIEANGLSESAHDLRVLDMRNIDPRFIAETRPTLVMSLEVLEHLDNPLDALRVMTRNLPESTDVLVSVPLRGRLEFCAGHHSFFDVDRIQRMIAGAGLHVQFVEPIENTWAFLLLSKSDTPSNRLARLMASAPALPSAGDAPIPFHEPFVREERSFQRVPLEGDLSRFRSRWKYRSRRVTLGQSGVRSEVEAGDDASGSHYGGISVPVPALRGMRGRIGLEAPERITHLHIDACGEDRKPVLRWRRRIGRAAATSVIEFALSATETQGGFEQLQDGDWMRVGRVDVYIATRAGAEVAVSLEALEIEPLF